LRTEAESFSAVPEGRVKTSWIQAQSAAIAQLWRAFATTSQGVLTCKAGMDERLSARQPAASIWRPVAPVPALRIRDFCMDGTGDRGMSQGCGFAHAAKSINLRNWFDTTIGAPSRA
jgi:hypothetical protein